jgi:radical SAM modification target selenobiotic family peptide
MDKHDLKKILAGISIASLLTVTSIGCASTPGKEAPAPGS